MPLLLVDADLEVAMLQAKNRGDFLRPKLRKGEGAYGWGILGNFGRKLRIDFGDFVTERISKVGIGPPTDVVIHATKCGMVGRH